jgi:hypothetical protein
VLLGLLSSVSLLPLAVISRRGSLALHVVIFVVGSLIPTEVITRFGSLLKVAVVYELGSLFACAVVPRNGSLVSDAVIYFCDLSPPSAGLP